MNYEETCLQSAIGEITGLVIDKELAEILLSLGIVSANDLMFLDNPRYEIECQLPLEDTKAESRVEIIQGVNKLDAVKRAIKLIGDEYIALRNSNDKYQHDKYFADKHSISVEEWRERQWEEYNR